MSTGETPHPCTLLVGECVGGLGVYLCLPLLSSLPSYLSRPVPRFLMSLSSSIPVPLYSLSRSLSPLLPVFSLSFLSPPTSTSLTLPLSLLYTLVSPPSFHTGGYNHLDVVEYLLEKGADVNAKDKGGLIPLHNAASYGVRSCNLIMTPLFL